MEAQVKKLLAQLEKAKKEAAKAKKAPAKKAPAKKAKKAPAKKAAAPTKKPPAKAKKTPKKAKKAPTKKAPPSPPKRPERKPGREERKLRLTREMVVQALQEAFEESREQGRIPTYPTHPPRAWMYRRGQISLFLTLPVGQLVTREVIDSVYMEAQLAADEVRDTMLVQIQQDGRLPDPDKLRFATTLEAFSFGEGNANGKSARTVIDTTKAGKRINEIATVFYMGHRSVRYRQYANELRQLLERILEPPTVLLCLWVYGWEKVGKKRNRRGP